MDFGSFLPCCFCGRVFTSPTTFLLPIHFWKRNSSSTRRKGWEHWVDRICSVFPKGWAGGSCHGEFSPHTRTGRPSSPGWFELDNHFLHTCAVPGLTYVHSVAQWEDVQSHRLELSGRQLQTVLPAFWPLCLPSYTHYCTITTTSRLPLVCWVFRLFPDPHAFHTTNMYMLL